MSTSRKLRLRYLAAAFSAVLLSYFTITPSFAVIGDYLIIKSAYYGSNCRSSDYQPDPQYPQNTRNVTFLLLRARHEAMSGDAPPQALVNSRDYMKYHIDHRVIGDPALGCQKEFVVTYQCVGDGPPDRVARVRKEASGQDVELDCR